MGKVISVISGKGGVGKTTFTSNFVLSMALKYSKKTLVVDMDIGNLFLAFGLKEFNFNVDLIDVLYNKENLSNAIFSYRKNLYFLGLKNKNELKYYSNEDFKLLLESLKEKFDYIVLDVGAGINENFKKSVFVSDYSIVVIDSTLLSYKISERTVKNMNQINKNINSFLVLNKYDIKLSKEGVLLKKEDVIKHFKIPLIGVVPYNENNVTFLNKGIPYYLNQNDRSFFELCNSITNRFLTKTEGEVR